ncbi:MAG TPA: sulfatase-like hydrolase/transferase [Anaerolineales bacterium]|nr:sulfatase-like hydrolase/transferase [Anaerolineales bacterium]
MSGGFPVYPLLFGIYPALALAAFNISQIDLSSTYRSILVSILLVLALAGILRLALRDWVRAAFLSFLLLVLFFTYGHVYNLLKSGGILGASPAGYYLLLAAWAALAGGATWTAVRKKSNLAGFTLPLNLVFALLLVFPLFQILRHELRMHAAPAAAASGISQPADPDIYYIILDAYERADTLKVVYDYDNSAFVDALAGRGFYVAGCSQSNYAYTQPSLTSSLNMNYLDALSVTSNTQADPLLQQNAVRKFLKSRGYAVVAFETGFSWSQWEDADFYYRYRPDAGAINGFEALFMDTTLLRLPLDALQARQAATYGIIPHNRILYVLDTLKTLPGAVRSPKFVFVHLVVPHPPFVFSPTGGLVTAGAENATSLEGYRNSVTFINQAILQVVDRILADSKTPPIIVIQGDHAAPLYHSPLQRMTILNAYYLPGAQAPLYPTISPVNTFRLILDSYFGQNYPLLNDVSWYSPTNREYAFEAIPSGCNHP